MSNGLANSFRLGLHWCACIFAFATLAADQEILDYLSDINSDTASLNYLGDIEEYTYSIQSDVDSINIYASDISEFTLRISDQLGYTSGNTLRSSISTIINGLETLSRLLGKIESGESTIETYDYQNYNQWREFDRKFSSFSQSQTNLTSDISNQLGTILSSINNLTNYLCYSPEYVSAINTNLPALFGYGVPVNDFVIEDIFYNLYGRIPTAEEIGVWYGLSNFGMYPWLGYQKYITINSDVLPSDLLRRYTFLQRFYFPYDFGFESYLSQLYYYEYGTRPIVELLQAFTNDFPMADLKVALQVISAATNDYPMSGPVIEKYDDTSDGTVVQRSRFTSSFVDTVSDLGSSYSSAVDDEVATVDTNEIEQVENGSYRTELNNITSERVLEAGQLSDLQSAVENMQQQFQSLIPVPDNVNSLTFSLGSLSFFGNSREVSFTVSRLPELYWSLQNFFFILLKAVCLLIVVSSIYTFVTQDTDI